MGEVNAQYVMLQLSILKTEILKGVEESIRKVVKEEMDSFRKEVDEKIEKSKTEQTAYIDVKVEELKQQHESKETELLAKIYDLQTKYEDMMQKHESHLKRIVQAEDRQRRTNVVVSNYMGNEELTCEENAELFFKEKLSIPQEKISKFLYRNIHYLGREQSNQGRSFIVAFLRQTDRDLVMSYAKNLKGTKISIKPNYSPETRSKKDEMLNLRKTLQSDGMITRVVERGYQPLLQVQSSNGRWSNYDAEY